jgi:hypothetical protein
MPWDTFGHIEFHLRHRSGFFGDNEFVYGPPPVLDVKMDDVEEPPAPKEEVFVDDDIPGKETLDDTDNYLGYLVKG